MKYLATLALFSCVGCSTANWEEYSLVVRKPAHRYHELSDWEKRCMEERRNSPVVEDAANPEKHPLINLIDAPDPFRPFKYCYRHKTTHLTQSMAAVVCAPAEFPSCLAINTAGVFLNAVGVMLPLEWGTTPSRHGETLPPELKPKDH